MIDPSVRSDFTILRSSPELVFLDSVSTTLVPSVVSQATHIFLEEIVVSSRRGAYSLAVRGNEVVEATRKEMAEHIRCSPREISFQSTISQALLSILFGDGWQRGRDAEIVIVENVPNDVLGPVLAVSQSRGIPVRSIPFHGDYTDVVDRLQSVVGNRTSMVIASIVPMGFGVLAPTQDIARIVHEHNSLFLAEAVGDIGLSVFSSTSEGSKPDIVLTSANTVFFAPPGLVVQWSNARTTGNLRPALIGSSSIADIEGRSINLANQPDRFETGILNVPAIAGLREGVRYAERFGRERIHQHIIKLASEIERGLREIDSVRVYGPGGQERTLVGFNLDDRFGVGCHDVALFLEQAGIAVRSGLLCAHSLIRALARDGVVQVSPHVYNSREDISRFLEVVAEIGSALAV